MSCLRISRIILILLVACGASFAGTKAGKLTGRLTTGNGTPLANGTAFLFSDLSGPPPAPERYWRVPDEVVPLDGEGRFTANPAPGRYFLGAIKRTAGGDLGPPREGDIYLISRNAAGAPAGYIVTAGGITDIGTITGAGPFNMEMSHMRPGTTGMEGAIHDLDGKPVAGAFVFAFSNPRMEGKPIFVSDKTGPEGKFLLRVDEGGVYFLQTRDTYGGGPPQNGGVLGGYGEELPTPVIVYKGEITRGIDVKCMRVPARGPKQEQNAPDRKMKGARENAGQLPVKGQIQQKKEVIAP